MKQVRALPLSGLLPWLCCLALLMPAMVHAQVRAWLDRDSVELGGTVTLNIRSDSSASPDFSPLRADFEISNQTRNSQIEWQNGRVERRILHGIALVPKRTGALTVPALQVGNNRTTPLPLQVTDALPARSDGSALVFLETELDDATPYVQQSVGVVVRLFYAAQLASGSLTLDAPAGASLQVVGRDRNDVREVNGRRYNVAERRYLLIPERSGTLQLPGARFEGQAASTLFDDFFGSTGNTRLNATGPTQALEVQPQPTSAPQPWLPLHDLQLRYTQAPSSGRSGEAVTLEVEAVARGATRAQFTELPELDVGAGAQVFAEPAQYDESFPSGTPQLKITRRYAVVPRAPGTLAVPGMRLRWWDVENGEARTATLPDLTLQIATGNSAAPAAPVTVQTDDPLPDTTRAQDAAGGAGDLDRRDALPWPWIAALAALALLWLLTLVWGMRRGRRGAGGAVSDSAGSAGTPGHVPRLPDLRRALDGGDLAEATTLLCAMGGVQRLEQLIERLADPRQRLALQALQQARWAGQGDLAQVRGELKSAFRQGPRWVSTDGTTKDALPPLYPP